MSIQAVAWALEYQDLPLDGRTKEPASSCAFVLVALANHASPEGTDSFPSIETIRRYTKLSERAVQYALRALEDHGTIRRTPDPLMRAVAIRDPRKRPQSYDLVPMLRGAKSSEPSPDQGCKLVDDFAPEPSLNLKTQLREPESKSHFAKQSALAESEAATQSVAGQSLTSKADQAKNKNPKIKTGPGGGVRKYQGQARRGDLPYFNPKIHDPLEYVERAVPGGLTAVHRTMAETRLALGEDGEGGAHPYAVVHQILAEEGAGLVFA